MDFSRILNKPFLINAYNWTSSNANFSNLLSINIPGDIFNNFLAMVPFESASLYRMRACVLLQISGTPMHQGCLVASCLPSDAIGTLANPNQMLQAPHSFMYANESTSVCVEVPFYARTPLCRTDVNGDEVSLSTQNFGFLSVMVMDALTYSGAASTSLTVSAHIVFTEAEFYVPKNANMTWLASCGVIGKSKAHCDCETDISESYISPDQINIDLNMFKAESFTDRLYKIPSDIFDGLAKGAKRVTGDFIDTLRMGVRQFTGFHNPNSPSIDERMITSPRNFGNNVDQPTLFEKLDQHAQFDRIVTDYTFNTDVDEMDILHMLKKPAYVGKFRLSTTTLPGTPLMCYPITPYLEAQNNGQMYSPMRKVYECSRYWRGSLKLHLQAVMTNFHYCKLIVVRNYDSNFQLLTSYPSLPDTHNLITDTIEFSAGGQIATIDLPFCSQLEQLECTKDLIANALMHGMVYVYVMQPLTTNGSVPLSVSFNAYVSAGDDLQFYGYATDVLAGSIAPLALTNSNSLIKPSIKPLDRISDTTTTALPIHPVSDKVTKRLKKSVVEVEDIEPEMWENTNVKPDPSKKHLVDKTENYDYIFKAEAQVTTVGVSDQTDLNITEKRDVTVDSLLRMDDFKPMVNLRDYVRRMNFSYEAQITNNSALNGVLAYPVKNLVTQYSSGSPGMLALASNFFGMTGGLKIKAIVSSTTTPGSQLMYIPPGTNSNFSATDPQFAVAVPGSTAATPWFRNRNAYDSLSIAGSYMVQELPQTVSAAAFTSEFEFVIPNMNPYRFINNSVFIDGGAEVELDSNLGQIVIIFPKGATDTGIYTVRFMVGFTDETRFGFQTIAPLVTVPSVSSGGATVRDSAFNSTTIPYGSVLLTTSYPYAYRFNTTV